MLKHFKTMATALFLFGILFSGNAFCGDLDDGISKFTDDSIGANDTMGQADTNINFIVIKAMAEAKMRQKKIEQMKKNGGQVKGSTSNFNDGSGDSNENSVVVGAGAVLDGPIYNVILEK